jgi:hypothetical protein
MSDFVSFSVGQDVEKIKAKIANLAPDLANAGTEASAKYMLNILVNVEKPPVKVVHRAEAYPEVGGWFSQAQIRKFFAVILSTLPYKRGGMEQKWEILGSGTEVKINNRDPGSIFVYDDFKQARLNAMVGWLKMGVILKKYTPQMVRSFQNAVNQVLKKRGLT